MCQKKWKSNESIKLHKTKDGSYRIAISIGHTQTHKPNQNTMPLQWVHFVKHLSHASETARQLRNPFEIHKGFNVGFWQKRSRQWQANMPYTQTYAYMTICTRDRFINHLSHVSETARKARNP